MAFSRNILPKGVLREGELDSSMVGIGMNFAAGENPEANIEDTLLFASETGMVRDELRVLSVLVTWLGIHSRWINADRLIRIVRCQGELRVRVFWCAVARWLYKDTRFKRLQRIYAGPTIDLLEVGTEFHIQRHGEDSRFARGPLRIPANVLAESPADVLPPPELCRRHRAYRWRVVMGPSYRADMWAALKGTPDLAAAELARRTYGSFATAWQVKRDFALCHGTERPGAP